MTAAAPDAGTGRPADAILAGLRVPVVAAPMLIVSGPDLVIAACRAGVLGSFPTANPRGDGELERWLTTIETALAQPAADGLRPAPYVPNLIVHKSNVRLEADLAAITAHAPAAVITSVGRRPRSSRRCTTPGSRCGRTWPPSGMPSGPSRPAPTG